MPDISDPTPKLYHYNAVVTDAPNAVHDGDSMRVHLSLGLNIKLENQPLRLYGINAPELHGATKAAGEASRDKLRSLVLGKPLVVETFKDSTEKYGRWLAKVYVQRQGTWICANDELVAGGFAVVYLP